MERQGLAWSIRDAGMFLEKLLCLRWLLLVIVCVVVGGCGGQHISDTQRAQLLRASRAPFVALARGDAAAICDALTAAGQEALLKTIHAHRPASSGTCVGAVRASLRDLNSNAIFVGQVGQELVRRPTTIRTDGHRASVTFRQDAGERFVAFLARGTDGRWRLAPSSHSELLAPGN
jgi:hypothetical protein